MVVVKQFHLATQFERVLMLVANLVGYAGVSCTIAVPINHLYITVAFGVVVESKGNSEIEFLVFEVIAEPGIELKEPVGIEVIFGTEAYFVRKALAVAVAQVLRIQDGREFEVGMF